MIKRIIPGQSLYYYAYAGEENQLFEPGFSDSPVSSNGDPLETVLIESQNVEVQSGPVGLQGVLNTPNQPKGLVMFVDNDSRRKTLHQSIACNLLSAGLATLTFDLLTLEEQEHDVLAAELYADIGLMVRRTIGVMDWVSQQLPVRGRGLGCFGTRSGAPAVLIAAAERPEITGAVVSCGGQMELGSAALSRIYAPVLLVVSEQDQSGGAVNHPAFEGMSSGVNKEVRVVKGASDLFAEPEAQETVVKVSTEWFTTHLPANAIR